DGIRDGHVTGVQTCALPIFGFGLGAARYVLGRREVNTRDLRGYIARGRRGEPATQQGEELLPEERARETMAVQLRRSAGIDRPRSEERRVGEEGGSARAPRR